MSIGFTFTTGPCLAERGFMLLNDLCRINGAAYRRGPSWALVSLCRTGDILFNYENGCLNGESQTNLAGAGFHRAAIGFIDQLARVFPLNIVVEDETDFASHRDFKRLRNEHFYPWLRSLLKILEERDTKDSQNLSLCWDLNQYTPEHQEGTVITPIGRLNIKDLIQRVQDEGIEPFAQEFFIWNNQEKDARFYLNTAISMLWEDCYFMPSRRDKVDREINVEIIENLERSWELDASLPFPVSDYKLLCWLDAREPLDVFGANEYKPSYPIGYRRGLIMESVGNLTLTLPGSFIFEYNEDGCIYYDAMEDNWHIIQVNAFSAEFPNQDFMTAFIDEGEEPPELFSVGDAKCCTVFMGKSGSNGDYYYQTAGEIIAGNQVTLIILSYEKESEKEWAMELLRGFKVNLEQDI